jgi:uncharacterized protein (DUF1015 family)
MAEIIPFQGLRYNIDKIGGLELVTAPPYDVISENERFVLQKRSPYNITHLTLGKDVPGEDKYERAATSLSNWIKDGILLPDKKDYIYIYEQEYLLDNGLRRKRRGFIALLKLERFGHGAILPHEETLSAPREDRLRLLRACRASLSPIFMLYHDPERTIDSALITNKLITELENNRGEIHRIWQLTSLEAINKLKKAMMDKDIYLADGHHRYEAALTYRDERVEEKACNYIMAYLTNMTDDGLTILPVHRLIRLPYPDIDKIEKEAGKFFTIKNATSLDRMLSLLTEGKERHAIGFYSRHKGFSIFFLKDEEILSKILRQDRSIEWKMLDINILHELLLNQILGREVEKDSITYTTSAEEAVAAVESDKFNVAFFLNPIRASEVKSIALRGEKMPGKATYFYPKLLDGLVMWQSR